MNLKQLEVFLAVADSGSFSRGAEETFITQSTVSQHIASLEQELGVKLLDRTPRGALLTEGGKLFVNRARQVLTEVRTAQETMRRFRGVEEAELRVGGSTIPADYLIPGALPLFVGRYPGIRLTMVQGDSREILDRLVRDEVEIGVVGSLYAEGGIDFAPLGKDDILLVCSRNHPLAGRERVTLAELEREPFIVREAGSGTAKTVAEALESAGVPAGSLTVRACLGSTEGVKRGVAAGLGVAFISAIAVQAEICRGDLVRLPVSELVISRTFYVATRSGRELSPAAQAFSSVITEFCG